MAEKKQVEAITGRDEDFARWYTDIVKKAELIEYTSVKGCMVIRPYGYAIWENMQRILDAAFKATGHENVEHADVHSREPAAKGKGPRRGLRARGGVGHARRQREAGGAPLRPPNVGDAVL